MIPFRSIPQQTRMVEELKRKLSACQVGTDAWNDVLFELNKEEWRLNDMYVEYNELTAAIAEADKLGDFTE